MKRISVLLALLILLTLAACAGEAVSPDALSSGPTPSPTPEVRELDPEKLNLAEDKESCPSVEMVLTEFEHSVVRGQITNNSDLTLCQDGLYLQVQLDGIWYWVNYVQPFAETAALWLFQPGVSRPFGGDPAVLYGVLPDGHYRFVYEYWYNDPDWNGPVQEDPEYREYANYAEFYIVNGQCSAQP